MQNSEGRSLIKASDAVARLLAHKKIFVGFELIGGMITHLVDSINNLAMTKLVSVHHEQGAAFAAGGVARATNNEIMGLALGTSGPGATNLVTGIADCWFDNIPCLFLTGQVNTSESRGDKKIKQQGFQELDIISIVCSITKYAKKIECVEQFLPELDKAIDLARNGRPGPVLLDIPMNIQRELIDEQILLTLLEKEEPKPFFSNEAKIITPNIQKKLRMADKPLVLLGGGAVNDPQFHDFIKKLNTMNIPYAASLKGSEKITEAAPYLGMIGAYGTRVANYALQNCDLLLVIGSRLDVRQTGADCQDFSRKAYVIQIDIDEHQLNNRIKADESFCLDVHSFYKEFSREKYNKENHNSWVNHLLEKKKNLFINEYQEIKLNPFVLFNLMNQRLKNKEVQFVCDVGNNQMWAAHTLRHSEGQKTHHSGGLGAMGFAIPTSIGVHLGSQKPVISFSGDGGAQLNIQELDIIAREKLPILTIILNNKALGMVKNFQDLYFAGRNRSTYWKSYSSDFVKLGQGYNMHALHINSLEEFNNALELFLQTLNPLLIEINIEEVNECRPRLAFGDKLDNQSPKLEFGEQHKVLAGAYE
ncbi:thiamine pyrophosphate-binding protein [Legionella drancourtii]|uniref:Acetolactate synthase n=1 Tax=Legionella drancourtii LLAP12 TaxID=658187 RepID=G9ENB6_9GAMM|nr:thiamine pyrophosphate-binding protein [Legionella drancourtii]EHL31277.1 hypothetical protein LDG_6738 [Legionella drancourtii LLAP12]